MFCGTEAAKLLAAIGDCRDACVRASGKAPINEPIYQRTHDVMTAIDGLAEVLTGDRTHFLKPVWPSHRMGPVGGSDEA